MNYVCVNGKIVDGGGPVLKADNRGFRYGDGLFETMRMTRSEIPLERYHFQRLNAGIKLLRYEAPAQFNSRAIMKQARGLARKNGCADAARVRLTVFRGEGMLAGPDQRMQWLIECVAADSSIAEINKKGYAIGIYPEARKSLDRFCNLKSASFLPYSMAAHYAAQKNLNDCLVLNTSGHVADASIANIFLIKKNMIITPALSEGCVDGVMRRYLLEKLRQSSNYEVREGVITRNDLESFEEVFLTNAVYGMRWVRRFGKKTYSNARTMAIYGEFAAPLFS